jgi:uncharacterized protein YndB with AHSA1/START domain
MRLLAALVLALTFGVQASHAEIVSAGPGGFHIRHVAEVPNAPPPTVWAALSDVAKWWDPEHTFSGDARNLSLDPTVRGCFCEKLSLYAGVEHATVVHAHPTKLLRLSGALGPLQEFGVQGTLTWQLEAGAGGTRITMTYSAGGFADRPLSDWAPVVDDVLGVQLKRLSRFVTTGNPAEIKPGG